LSGLGQGNLAPLFGNNDDRGIGTLGEAQTCTVSGAEVPRQFGVGGEREVTGRLGDPVVPDDDGAVMQGGARPENGTDELGADQAVEMDTMEQVFIQDFLALKDDNGAGFFRGQHKKGPGKLHQVELRAVTLTPEQVSQEAETIERLPDLSLENDDQKDKQYCPQLLKDPAGHEEPEIFCYDIQEHQKT